MDPRDLSFSLHSHEKRVLGGHVMAHRVQPREIQKFVTICDSKQHNSIIIM